MLDFRVSQIAPGGRQCHENIAHNQSGPDDEVGKESDGVNPEEGKEERKSQAERDQIPGLCQVVKSFNGELSNAQQVKHVLDGAAQLTDVRDVLNGIGIGFVLRDFVELNLCDGGKYFLGGQTAAQDRSRRHKPERTNIQLSEEKQGSGYQRIKRQSPNSYSNEILDGLVL